jgi:hypothetical protein
MNLTSAECTVETPDDGQRRCPKHAEFYNRINWIIGASDWSFKNRSITMHSNMNVKYEVSGLCVYFTDIVVFGCASLLSNL